MSTDDSPNASPTFKLPLPGTMNSSPLALRIKEFYKNVEDVDLVFLGSMGKRVSKNDWDDNFIQKLKHIDVRTIQDCSDEVAINILELGLSSLTSNVTIFSVGALIVGAWGLYSSQDKSNFALTYPATMSVTPESINNLDKEWITRAAKNPAPVSFSNLKYVGVDRFRRSASYLCAAALRMITKDHGNLLRSWGNIKLQYKKYYNEEIAINLNLDGECVRGVEERLKHGSILKNTIGVFLLAYQDLGGQDKELCKMLYEVYLSFTGMHAYTLLKECAPMLNTPLYNLIAMLDFYATRSGLKCAMHVLETYDMPETEEAKNKLSAASTWKYARIFDEAAFGNLQTKNCVALTYILARIAQQVGGSSYQHVTKIRQLETIGSSLRDTCEEKAKRIIEYCMNANAECVEKKMKEVSIA